MDCKDYMIGNYLVDRKGNIAKVEEISIDEGVKAFSGMITCFPLSPVKITKEILIDTGFKKCYENLFIKEALVIYLDARKKYFYLVIEDMQVIIKYLHNLQNLYKSLFGENLKLSREFLKSHSNQYQAS